MNDNYLVILYCERCKRWSQTQITTVTRCPFCGLEIKGGRQFLRLENKRRTPMNDLISRAAAIDAFMTSTSDGDKAEWCKWVLEQLPSAQPEKAQLSGEDATFDCVSRQAAIDANSLDEEIRCEMCRNPMHTDRGCDGNCKYDEILYEKIIRILDKRITPLPSAQPEIIRCKDCKHHWTHRCMDSMPTEICELDQTFYDANVDFCSLAERRTDEGD